MADPAIDPTQVSQVRFTLSPTAAEAVGITTMHTDFQNERVFCMDGYEAQKHDTGLGVWGPDNINKVSVGEYCRGLLEASADAQRNGSKYHGIYREDLELLAPFRAIAADKGFPPSDADAQQVVDIFRKASADPKINTNRGSVEIPTTRKPLVLVPGAALDAEFTAVVQDAFKNGTTPAKYYPQVTEDQLTRVAEACFRNNGVGTIAQCKSIGHDLAASYLASSPPRKVAER